eukprot:jgi/Orpsp1_1/1174608/evm.model.c7180000050742.1
MEVEIQNSSYGSIDNSKPLYSQRSYNSSLHSQPFSEVKYESLNEIHLDFSKAKPFQGGLKSVNSNNSISKSINNNITSTPLTTSPKLSAVNLKNNSSTIIPSLASNPSTTTLNNKNYLNSIHSNSTTSNSTTNSSTTYVTSQSNTLQNINSNSISNNTINNSNDDDISLKSRMKRKNGPNVFIDTKFKNDISSSMTSSANTTFNIANANPTPTTNSDVTPSTEITLDSPFLFRNFENTPTPVSNTPTPTSETPKTANTSFSALHLFKSILSPISKKQEQAINLNENDENADFLVNNLTNLNDTKLDSISKPLSFNTSNNKSRSIQQNTNTNNSLSSYNSKTPTFNFKSFQSFDFLKDQLEKSAREQNNLNAEYSKEQMIHNQFSEQYREEFNAINTSPLKKGNAYIFPTGKDDPFNPYNDSNYNPSQAIDDSNDSFLASMNNQPHFDKLQDFNFNSQSNPN